MNLRPETRQALATYRHYYKICKAIPRSSAELPKAERDVERAAAEFAYLASWDEADHRSDFWKFLIWMGFLLGMFTAAFWSAWG